MYDLALGAIRQKLTNPLRVKKLRRCPRVWPKALGKKSCVVGKISWTQTNS